MIFRAGEQPVFVLGAGVNHVDKDKAANMLQTPLEKVDGKWVRQATSFAIGGVAPIGHIAPAKAPIYEALMTMPKIWAAAGSPTHIFAIAPVTLQKMKNGINANSDED